MDLAVGDRKARCRSQEKRHARRQRWGNNFTPEKRDAVKQMQRDQRVNTMQAAIRRLQGELRNAHDECWHEKKACVPRTSHATHVQRVKPS